MVRRFLIEFQNYLKKEVLRDFKALDKSGKEVEINVFRNSLPVPKGEKPQKPCPYIVVRIAEGGTKNNQSGQIVRLVLLLGFYNDALDNSGYDDLLILISKIQTHFKRTPQINPYYRVLDGKDEFGQEHPFEYAIQAEDTYPYFYGGIQMDVMIPAIRLEADFT